MNENRKLDDGVELVKEDIFWPEGEWSIRRGEYVWSRANGWQKYYEVKREESQFKTAKEAMAACDSRSMTRQLEKDEACEFCYAPAVSVCIHCETAVCKGCSETINGQTVCNECLEVEDSEFDAGGEG